MKTNHLHRLIRQGESQTVDFKRRIAHAHKIAKTVTAFANTHGGLILVGVQDDGSVVGVDPEEEKHVLQQAATFYCEPSVSIEFSEAYESDGTTVLIAHVPDSPDKPHSAIGRDGARNCYVRVMDKCLITSKTSVNALEGSGGAAIGEKALPKKAHQREKRLIDYLRRNERITVKSYAKLLNVSERRARRSLTTLAQSGILFLHDLEKEDFYTLA